MNATAVFGTIAAVVGSCMAASPLLQARLIRRTRSSRDVSIGALWIFVFNCLAWLSYGVSLGSATIAIPNAIGLGALAVAISVALRYRNGDPSEAAAVVETAPVATQPAHRIRAVFGRA